MLVNNSTVNFNSQSVEKTNVNTKTTEVKTESLKLSTSNDNLKIGVQTKLSQNEAKIATPIKLYSDSDKIKTQRTVASGLIGVAIAGSAFTLAKSGFKLGSEFGIKGAIIGAAVTGTAGALIAGATAGAVDDRMFDSMKAVGIGGAVAGAAFAVSASQGKDLKTSAILIGAGALAGAGLAMGAAYSGGSNHKPLF